MGPDRRGLLSRKADGYRSFGHHGVITANKGEHPVTNLPTTMEELEGLAAAGAIGVVAAMATETFKAARSGIARLFARRDAAKGEAAQTQLDEDQALVVEAVDADRDEVRGDLSRLWRRRLLRLLKEDEAAAADLRALLQEWSRTAPVGQQAWIQNNSARDRATQFAVQGGNQEINYLGSARAEDGAGE